MLTVSGAQIAEDVRVRAGLPAYASDSFITQAMVLGWVLESGLSLTGKLISTASEGRFTHTASIATVAGEPSVDLSAITPRVYGVRWLSWMGDERETQLDVAQPEDMFAEGAWSDVAPSFAMGPDAVTLYPTPDAVYALRLIYLSALHFDPSTPDALVSVDLGWREWVALDACVKVRARQEKDPSDLVLAQQGIERTILACAPMRTPTAVKQVRDMRGAVRPSSSWWRR